MAEIVNCPQCERKLKVPDTLLGKSVKCPTCGATFTAETGGEAPPPPPPREEEERYEEQPEERVSRRSSRAASRREERYEDEYDDDRGDDDYDDRPRRRSRRRSRYRGDLVPHRGTLILVLGILAIVGVAPIILGPIAWIMGNNDLEEIRAGRMDPEGEGTTNGGRICGMIATILWIAGTVLFCGCCMFMAIMDSAGG